VSANALETRIEFFKKNGYVILEDIYTEEECDEVINLAHKILGSSKDLTPLMNIHKSSETIQKFMSNKNLLSFINSYFQDTAMGLQTEFFFMPPGTVGFNAHQDNTYVKATSDTFISAWCALTDVDKDNGGLIIWPETHNEEALATVDTGLLKVENQDPNATIRKTLVPEKYKKETPKIKKGSVLLIHSWLAHASHVNNSNKNRYALLCTYLKEHTDFRKGTYAKRIPFSLDDTI
jgi:ectoine hydroxylase-related dioxygenase (phytanoyl-CoA dioxygenase family)